MRYFSLLAVFVAGCSSSIGDAPQGGTDARPIDYVRETPEPKGQTGSADGCNGITARGECIAGKAYYCDLELGRTKNIDCAAKGKDCVLGVGKRVQCEELPEDNSVGGGRNSPCQETGISEAGLCTTDGSAVFCEVKSGEKPVTKIWNCEEEGKSCKVGMEDGCSEGASCCGGEVVEKVPCGDVSFEGSCNSGVATWCDPVKGLVNRTCAEEGKRCVEDDCAEGAFCCGQLTTTACGDIDEFGKCAADGKSWSYCDTDDNSQYILIKETCTGNTECQDDGCNTGAECCEIDSTQENECQRIGWLGECKDGNTLRICLGTENSDIQETSCGVGEMCVSDPEDGFSECVAPTSICPGLGIKGECTDDEEVRYCNGPELHTVDCISQVKFCEINAGGYAVCK